VTLLERARFVIDAELDANAGTLEQVGVTYKALPGDVFAGDTLLVDDGRIVLDVERVQGARIETVVKIGGPLSNHKGINRQGGGLTAPALTAKDMEDVRTAAQLKADYLAVSFPKTSADMYMARQLLLAAGGHAMLIAKIERAEAVTEKALAEGKPADIVAKMVEGRIRKTLNEKVLLGQSFVKDPDQTIEKLLKAAKAEVKSFQRFEVGDGIEKKQDDFVGEVMAQVKASSASG